MNLLQTMGYRFTSIFFIFMANVLFILKLYGMCSFILLIFTFAALSEKLALSIKENSNKIPSFLNLNILLKVTFDFENIDEQLSVFFLFSRKDVLKFSKSTCSQTSESLPEVQGSNIV